MSNIIKKFNIFVEKMNESDEFKSAPSIMSDYKGRDLSVTRGEDGLLFFDFDSMGWLFDTNDVAEGCAICKGSHFIKDEGLRQIQITQADKDNVKPEEALYWLTGGNKEWKFGDAFNVSWDKVADEVTAKFGHVVTDMVKDSNTLGELMDKMASESGLYGLDMMDFYQFMSDEGYVNYDDEEDEDAK